MSKALCPLLLVLFLWSGPVGAECRIPWPVRRTGEPSCWAKVRVKVRGEVCVEQSEWRRWLSAPDPRCIEIVGPAKLLRPPTLDLPAAEVRERVRGVVGSRAGGPLLRLHRLIERQRERFSVAVAPHDPSGWLRAWIVGERADSVFFTLGFVHLLTTAGVHLLGLSRLIKKGWWEIPIYLWVWALSGWRFGMARPLALIGFQRITSGFGIRLRSPIPLLLVIGLEACLFKLDAGGIHYLAAVWGGAWGMRKWGTHLGMALGSWLWVVPIQLFEDRSVSLLTPILSLITIPVASMVLFPAALVLVLLGVGALPLGSVATGLIKLWLPLALLPGMNWVAEPLSTNASHLIQLNVGQGDSALVVDREGAGQVGLVDAGPERAASAGAWLSAFRVTASPDSIGWCSRTSTKTTGVASSGSLRGFGSAAFSSRLHGRELRRQACFGSLQPVGGFACSLIPRAAFLTAGRRSRAVHEQESFAPTRAWPGS